MSYAKRCECITSSLTHVVTFECLAPKIGEYVIVTGYKCLKNYFEVMGTCELWVTTGDLQKLNEMIWKGLWYVHTKKFNI